MTQSQKGQPRKVGVLHLIYSCSYGGIETAVLNWVRGFDRSRFDIHVAYFAGDRSREIPFLKAAEAAGINVIPVPWTKFKPFLRCAREVARMVREHDIDIVHTHAYYGDAVGALAGLIAPVRIIATVYVWGKYELHRQLMQFIDWTSIQFMDKVTAHCRDTWRRTFVLGVPRAEIPILVPGYPEPGSTLTPSERSKVRRGEGIGDGQILLLNAGRLAPEKAHDQLLESFRLVHDRFPQTHLWICGEGLPQVERNIRALRKKLDLESSVEMKGFRSDYAGTLQMADMMVHPSHVEGMPLAIMGGAAAGLPIVASAIGDVPEILDNGRAGCLIQENDVKGFAAQVMVLLEDPEQARKLGIAAGNRMRTEFSIRAAVTRVEDVYQEMLLSHPRHHLRVLRSLFARERGPRPTPAR